VQRSTVQDRLPKGFEAKDQLDVATGGHTLIPERFAIEIVPKGVDMVSGAVSRSVQLSAAALAAGLLAVAIPAGSLAAESDPATSPANVAASTGTDAVSPETTGGSPARPADPVLSHYNTYLAALTAGRLNDARAAGVAAWAAARTAWADTNPNKGALAYNAAWIQTVTGQAAAALDAARAAVALSRAGGPYLVEEARLLLASAELEAAGAEAPARLVRAVDEAALPLEALEAPDPVVGRILADAARRELDRRSYASALRLAGRSIDALAKSGEGREVSSIAPYLTRALAQLGRSNAPDSTLRALTDVNTAVMLWGPRGDNPPEAFYTLVAWQLALRGVAMANGKRGDDLSRTFFGTLQPPWERSRAALCGTGWRRISGDDLSYPGSALFEGRVGGAVIVAQLDPAGQVLDARVAASIPAADFGERAVRSIRSWRYEIPAEADASCLRDHLLFVTYTIDR
jgi:TonB family protein